MENNRGSALIYVLVVLVVMSILGITLLNVGLSETKQVKYQEFQKEAYYIARSGADATIKEILNKSDNILLKKIENLSTGQSILSTQSSIAGLDGTYIVDISYQNYSILVKSTGTINTSSYGMISSSATVVLSNFMNRAVIGVSGFDINGLRVLEGDVESINGAITGTPGNAEEWDGDSPTDYVKYETTGRELPSVVEPVGVTEYNDGVSPIANMPHDFKPGHDAQIPGSFKYGEIDMGNNTLIIDTTLGDVEIVTDVLKLKDGFEILGTNHVFITIASSTDGASEIKTNSTNSNLTNQLFIFLVKDAVLNISTGGQDFNGYIYGPEATVSVASNSTLTGNIVAGTFYGTSNASITYEPLAVTPDRYPAFIDEKTRYSIQNWK